MSFNLQTWDGFSDLKKEEADYLLDTTSINKRLKDKQKSPYRMRVGSFQLPKGIQGEMKDRACDKAVKSFLLAFEKQGLDLASKVQVYGPFPCYDIRSNILLLDKEEWRARALFKTKPKPMRIELPPGIIKRDPEHRITLKEAMKIEGITPERKIPRS